MSGAAVTDFSVGTLPGLVTPSATIGTTPASLIRWMESEGAAVTARLHREGALLFRGFQFSELADFEHFTSQFTDTLTTYVGGASQRTRVEGKVFTSTNTAAHFTINQHHEGAYLPKMPRMIGFFCRVPAAKGGQTPLADSRRVLARLPADLRTRFEQLGVRYINNLPNRFGIGKSWQVQFQSEDRATVEALLLEEGYEFIWKPCGGLRTSTCCPAVRVHPVTGERAWVAQADHWHPSGLDPTTRASMAKALPESEFPLNATYGDGTPLDERDLDVIRAAIRAETVQFDWHAGDVLICDNFLVSHGRQPNVGERKVFVTLG
ncbi:MAG: Taurine catabolism dioxygenase TauD/TfdA [Verrucomicrobiales bacterium]|nr:Taurine catabolism dioxygenase TauD/TfdA [Verrucomicrobiales bacterium]